MNILVACEESQAVTIELRKLGQCQDMLEDCQAFQTAYLIWKRR